MTQKELMRAARERLKKKIDDWFDQQEKYLEANPQDFVGCTQEDHEIPAMESAFD